MDRPSAIEVIPLDNYILFLRFSNGEEKYFDLKPYLERPFYKPLLAIEEFATVHIAGLSIEWSNGRDICPDDLYNRALGQTPLRSI